MKFLACTVDSLPCPENAQILISYADLITDVISIIEPADFAASYAFGAASVVTWWCLGFAISAAIKVLKKA